MDSISEQIYFGIACLVVGILVLGIIEGIDWVGGYLSAPGGGNPLLHRNRIDRLFFAQELINQIERAESTKSINPDFLEEIAGQAEYLKPFDDIQSVYIEIKGILSYLKGNLKASEAFFWQATTCSDYTGYLSSLAKSWESSKRK